MELWITPASGVENVNTQIVTLGSATTPDQRNFALQQSGCAYEMTLRRSGAVGSLDTMPAARTNAGAVVAGSPHHVFVLETLPAISASLLTA